MTEPGNTEHGCYTEHGVSGYGVAVKLSRAEAMDAAWVRAMGEEMMLTIANNCMGKGARCIGHIKSHMQTETGTLKADTIGTSHGTYSSGELAGPVTEIYMAVNSIVQGIPEDQVRSATLDGIHAVALARGLNLIREKEHSYFDEFDFTASKQEYAKKLAEQFEEGDE
ncbi:MAG: hypothetical protein KQJ78_04625 [Deltaproteobacteria bacterium]|nr:hypothetical protein [Deltaproteobacteria bacterium]